MPHKRSFPLPYVCLVFGISLFAVGMIGLIVALFTGASISVQANLSISALVGFVTMMLGVLTLI